MKNLKSLTDSPLILCCIIGIVAGFAASYFIDSVDQNRLLTIGLIGGLVVGYLLENSKKKSSTGESLDPSDLLGGQSASEAKAAIQDADDVIARARASISGEAPAAAPVAADTTVAAPAAEPVAPAVAPAAAAPAEVSEGQAKINEMEDLFKSAREGLDDTSK